jgi:hypothetical protein
MIKQFAIWVPIGGGLTTTTIGGLTNFHTILLLHPLWPDPFSKIAPLLVQCQNAVHQRFSQRSRPAESRFTLPASRPVATNPRDIFWSPTQPVSGIMQAEYSAEAVVARYLRTNGYNEVGTLS